MDLENLYSYSKQVLQYDGSQWQEISQPNQSIRVEGDVIEISIEDETFTITKDHIKAFIAMVEEAKPEYFV